MSQPLRYLLSYTASLGLAAALYHLSGGAQLYEAMLFTLILLWLVNELWFHAFLAVALFFIGLSGGRDDIAQARRKLTRWSRLTSLLILLLPHPLYALLSLASTDANSLLSYDHALFLSSYASVLSIFILSFPCRLTAISPINYLRTLGGEAMIDIPEK